jgi:hypothetical protein
MNGLRYEMMFDPFARRSTVIGNEHRGAWGTQKQPSVFFSMGFSYF